LLSGSWDAKCKVWNLNDWSLKATLESSDHAHAVTCCILPSGDILTGSSKKGMVHWCGKEFFAKKKIPLAHEQITRAI
jgi:WD40 repeat protein